MINGLPALSTFLDNLVNRQRRAGRCVACLASSAHHGLCDGCHRDLPVNRWHCHRCALPLAFDGPQTECGECLRWPPAINRSLVPWRYQYPVNAMISRYKDHGQRTWARPLLAGLAEHIRDTLPCEDRPDLLIPAPMHWQRRWSRGFNQAQDIAEHLGGHLDIPVASALLRRRKKVSAQRGLDRHQRLANLAGVFEVTGPVPARVAIIDDVVTTGATARRMAEVLRVAGARDIQVWALARTPG
ncbi:MAG TPA: ComF family protein [Marinobacter sp.]|jgi:ComF family protein|nr:ComF family protein [Marinobacter sp.]